ncbi:sensor histidine kinase [Paenibacillus sp. CC-CFT747]|nr:sensor histidine kinase [Paenibacillus sp. CC-CFT747]
MLIVKAVSAATGWSLVMIQPAKNIFHDTTQLKWWTFGVIGASLIVALWMSLTIFNGIARPIKKMVHAMKQVRNGQLETVVTHDRQDEFGYMMDSFNLMTQGQRHLIQDVYEKQLRLAKTEFKLLQSQINPHFLYNTLDTIYSEAILNGADELGEMVLNLSRFFRYSLGKGRETYTVAETFEHLAYYLEVQRIRCQGQLIVHTRIAPEVKDLHVLKLAVQPLVENAILHGWEKKTGTRELWLSAQAINGVLQIDIRDNGVGIPEERLAAIMENLGKIKAFDFDLIVSESRNSAELFGLRNVKARIKLHYGEEANMEVDSEEGMGTCIRLSLPIAMLSAEGNTTN